MPPARVPREAAESADDHRLEGVEEARLVRWSGRRSARAPEDRTRRSVANGQRESHGKRVDAAIVDADELGRLADRRRRRGRRGRAVSSRALR